ncbi:MAG: GAF domain-containing protein [Terriglobales bacterium]
MHESLQPDEQLPSANSEGEGMIAATDHGALGANRGVNRAANPGAGDAVAARSNGGRALQEPELDSALQLLVERAQYITGATGTALALAQGEEMVCRASAGASAPPVGARLQVRTGLTGESVSRRQLLRCDNAETDPRVNLEACRALGIASIVVLPLLRSNGEVCGLFELFSDHPGAFEERDLVALERIAGLTLTALDLSEQRLASVSQPAPAAVPEAMLRVPRCVSCGFPVPEGRTICLDCESKNAGHEDADGSNDNSNHNNSMIEERQPEPEQLQFESQIEPAVEQPIEVSDEPSVEPQEIKSGEPEPDAPPDPAADAGAATAEEFVPAFLREPAPAKESWLASHVNLLVVAVLILGIAVAVVVFR